MSCCSYRQEQVSLVCMKYCLKKPSAEFLLSLGVLVLQAMEHPSTTQSTSSAIPPHQLCPAVQSSALSFPHLDLNLQYLLEGFHLPSFVLCVWFGGSFSSLYTHFFPAPLHFYALWSLWSISLISTWTQCIQIQVLIFNLLNKGVEGEGLWASKTSLPSLNKHGSTCCLLWAGCLICRAWNARGKN